MKYLKSFEARDVLRGKDRSKIEEDINGILIELSDMKINYRISWVGNWTSGIIIRLEKSIEDLYNPARRLNDNDYVFKTTDVKDYLLTIEDYFREYWGDISVRYDIENYKTSLFYITEESLSDREVQEITFEVSRKK